MKTLKQILRRAWSEQDTNMILEYAKEWLQQKRLTIGKQTAFMLIQELLEELEHDG